MNKMLPILALSIGLSGTAMAQNKVEKDLPSTAVNLKLNSNGTTALGEIVNNYNEYVVGATSRILENTNLGLYFVHSGDANIPDVAILGVSQGIKKGKFRAEISGSYYKMIDKDQPNNFGVIKGNINYQNYGLELGRLDYFNGKAENFLALKVNKDLDNLSQGLKIHAKIMGILDQDQKATKIFQTGLNKDLGSGWSAFAKLQLRQKHDEKLDVKTLAGVSKKISLKKKVHKKPEKR